MNRTPILLSIGAAVAFAAAPALAQHDHGSMHGMQHGSTTASSSQGIAEGTVKNGVRTVEVSVTDDGFVPSRVKALKGEKVRLVVTRRTDRTCAKEIVIAGYGINQPLPLEKPVTVELTPRASGEIKYACGMDMISGVLLVP